MEFFSDYFSLPSIGFQHIHIHIYTTHTYIYHFKKIHSYTDQHSVVLISQLCKQCYRSSHWGYWVKNPTAAAWIDAEVKVQSPAWHSALKDLVLPQLWHRSWLWLRFGPCPGNFHVLWLQPLKKKKKSDAAVAIRVHISFLGQCFCQINTQQRNCLII